MRGRPVEAILERKLRSTSWQEELGLLREEPSSFQETEGSPFLLCNYQMYLKHTSHLKDKDIKDTFQTNLFSVIALTQKLLPLLKNSSAGRIVNVSTILSSLTLHSAKDSPIAPAKEFAYNASKTALNAYTVHLAQELKNTNIKVNSGHPGWVKTELGGPKAPIEVEDSYKTSLRLATLDDDGPSGGLFQGDDVIPW